MFAGTARRSGLGRLRSSEAMEARIRRLFPASAGDSSTAAATLLGLTVCGWIRLDNRRDIVAALPDSSGLAGRGASDAEIVAAAYVRWGAECVERFEGDFAFVILDSRDQSAFAARDALGVRPLYVALTEEVFAFSATAAVFDAVPGVDASVRQEWLIDSLHGQSADWVATPFAGITRVPPGHWLRVTRDHHETHRYHTFVGESVWEDSRDPRWLEAYRAQLVRAVSARTEPDGLIGVETSGGIDSSTVLGVMAHTHPEVIPAIHTVGFVSSAREPEFILATSLAHGIAENHIFTAARAGGDRQRRGWQVIGYPTEHQNSIGHIPFYSLASQLGVSSLHSGHGGDEMVTNAAGLVVDELLAHGQWRQAWRDLPGSRWARPARMAKRLRRRTGEVSHLTATMMSQLASSPVRPELLSERDSAARMAESARYQAPYTRVNDFVLSGRLSPATSIRAADSSLVAASYGIDYRFPLLDWRLIQQYLSTPAVWKFGEGYGRYLHRRAIASMVPDKVAWKPDKNMGPPIRPRPTLTASVSATEIQTADELLARLHPRIAELLDPARVRHLIQGRHRNPTDFVANRYLSRAVLLSEWLDDREANRNRE